MERRARLILWSLSPPFRKTVMVHRITVGGFLDLLRYIAPRVAEALIKSGKPLDDRQFIATWADAGMVATAADLVACDEFVDFMQPWLDGRLGGFFARMNTRRLLAACRQVEGDGQWTRFLSCINRTPKAGEGKKVHGGGLSADVRDICRLFGWSYQNTMDMALQDFLNLCDSINLAAEQERRLDPLVDPDVEASSAIPIPGVFQVH